MRAPAPDDTIVVASFDPATGVITDPVGRRVALLDPDGNYSVNAVATLFSWIAAGSVSLDALIAVRDAVSQRRGHLPPAVLATAEKAEREVLQMFFEAGGSLD